MAGRSICVAFLGSRVWKISIGRLRRGSIGRGTVKRGCIARAQEVTEIVSVKNRRVKEARGLLMRRHREQSNKILLEGQRLISDAVEAGISPHEVFYSNEIAARSDRVQELLKKVSQSGAETFLVSDGVIRALSDTVTPQGIVAVCSKPKRKLPEQVSLMLICDKVRDPGNVGTLIRSAAGAGVEVIALTEGSADAWGLKALRAGMGAQLRLCILSGVDWETLTDYVVKREIRLHVASAGEGSVCYTDVDWTKPSGLVIGSESEGPSSSAAKIADSIVQIPMNGGVESLNAAMAGSIILFEARRQRRL